MLALGLIVHGRRTTRFDSVVLRWLHVRVTGAAARAALDVGSPAISVLLLALVLIVAIRSRCLRLAVVTVAGPAVTSGITEFVIKPWVKRPYGTGLHTQVTVSLAFPSGHEALVASTAVVLLLATCRLTLHGVWRLVVIALIVAWVLGAGVGLVVNFWHYSTDVLGAIGLSAAVVLGAALVADRVSSPGGRALTRTTRAA